MSQSGSVPATGADVTTAPTDEDLLLAAAQGDQEAIGRLYDRHQGTMYGLAMRITNDAEFHLRSFRTYHICLRQQPR